MVFAKVFPGKGGGGGEEGEDIERRKGMLLRFGVRLSIIRVNDGGKVQYQHHMLM